MTSLLFPGPLEAQNTEFGRDFQFLKLRQPLRFLLKLLIFNCAVIAVYSLLLFVLGLESLRAEFSDMGKIMLLVTLVLGNGIFILFDFVLPRLELLYRCRFRPHLWR